VSIARGPEGSSGYTLAEILTVVGIIGMLALMAFLGHRGQLPRHRLDRATLETAAALRGARMQAVSECVAAEVSLMSSVNSFVIWVDSNTNGSVDQGEQQIKSLSEVPDLAIQSSETSGTFDTRGAFSGPAGCWRIQVTVPPAGSRWIEILPSGHVECLDSVP